MIEPVSGGFRVSGRLTMETVNAHRELPIVGGTIEGTQLIDLKQVDEVDSSALSLLLAWLRQAQIKQCNLAFVHAPDNLRSLADLYGLSDVLELRNS